MILSIELPSILNSSDIDCDDYIFKLGIAIKSISQLEDIRPLTEQEKEYLTHAKMEIDKTLKILARMAEDKERDDRFFYESRFL